MHLKFETNCDPTYFSYLSADATVCCVIPSGAGEYVPERLR